MLNISYKQQELIALNMHLLSFSKKQMLKYTLGNYLFLTIFSVQQYVY